MINDVNESYDNNVEVLEELVDLPNVSNDIHIPKTIAELNEAIKNKDEKAIDKALETFAINEKTGVIEYPAVDKLKNIYYKHPMTNTDIVGFKVPKYKEAVKLALKASKVVKESRYVGWDIAITDKGPVIIEGNEYPGHDIYQLPVHRTNNIGVLPKFEEALGKIEDLK